MKQHDMLFIYLLVGVNSLENACMVFCIDNVKSSELVLVCVCVYTYISIIDLNCLHVNFTCN